jgi:predicted permease
VLTLPLLLTFTFFAWWPLVRAGVLSVQETNLVDAAEWAGFDNFRRVLDDPLLWTAIKNTAWFAFLALVFGLTLMPAEPPAAIRQSLEMVAGVLLPIIVLALGMQLRLRLPREHLAPLAIGLVTKLVLMPLLALGLCAAFGLTGDMRLAAVYETAMPSMVTAGALLSMAGLAPELAAAMIGYGIVLSMITLPLWHLVLGSL